MPERPEGSHIVIPPLRRHFYGLIHQVALTAGQIGAANAVQVQLGEADFLLRGRSTFIEPAATGGRIKLQFEVVPGEVLQFGPEWASSQGSGQFPQFFRTARRIPGGAIFQCTADDRQLVAAAATVRVLNFGDREWRRPIEPSRYYAEAQEFKYHADFSTNGNVGVALPANGNIPFGIQIGRDADFQIHKVILEVTGDATIDIVSGAGKNLGWFSRPCHVRLLGATDPTADPAAGGLPFILPTPVWLSANASLSVIMADLSGAVNECLAVFEGVKLKPPGGLPVDPAMLERLMPLGRAVTD